MSNGGWHQPEFGRFMWKQPNNALTDEALAERATAQANPQGNGDGAEIGHEPLAPGAWYRPQPPAEAAPHPALIPPPSPNILPEFLISAKAPQDVFGFTPPPQATPFDASRSGALPGIQPDRGQFDASRSGALPGLEAALGLEAEAEAEPVEDSNSFDPALSGQLEGMGTAQLPQDSEPVNALPGIDADEGAAQPADLGSFDPNQSDQRAGIGANGFQAEAAPAAAAQAPQQDPFAEVEQKVNILRDQFLQGRITREQLQDELRRLMLLDDQGRWWMLGLETNRWYRYTGREWLPEEPPRPVVEPAAPWQPDQQAGADARPAGDNRYGVEGGPQEGQQPILPNRVPVEDLEATLVGATALEDHRSFDAPTQENPNLAAQVAGFAAGETIPNPAIQQAGMADGIAAPGMPGSDPNAPAEAANPHQPKMNGIQPDYSEAFRGYFDRATLSKWGLRVSIFGVVSALTLIFVAVLGAVIFYFAVINEYRDEINSLDDRASSFETTIIYDAEGNQLAAFNDPNTGARRYVPLEEISPWLIHATVATEDETFYENPGFSLWGILRATVRNVQTQGAGGGASTITQQLTRTLVFDPELASQRSAYRKIQEIFVASEIARQYSKNEILEIYLNEIYYSNLAYGIEAASQTYFNKPAAELDLAEAAFLAGLPQSPAVYDPVVRPEIAKSRMDQVLVLMTEANGDGCIQMQHGQYAESPLCVTQAELESTYVLDIAEVKVAVFQPPAFEATYPHFVNYVRQELEREFGQSVYGGGFQVYTTIRPSVQEAAQRAVLEELAVTPNTNNASVVVIRPEDGAVLALVGSADFNSDGRSEYNGADIDGLVNVAFTAQQPGSSIKPLVFLTAFEPDESGQYWYPGSIVWDVPSQFGTYVPRNFSGTFSGPVTARFALGNSLNIPAIKALAFVTPDRFERTLARFEMQTPLQTPSEAGLPSALGAFEVYPFEMARAMAALANGGVLHESYGVARIEDRNGNVIFASEENPVGLRVVREEVAYLLTHVMADPNARFAGAQSLSIPGWQAAAKTGTTNDNRDLWTVGYTTEAAVVVWAGNTDNSPTNPSVLGSNTAAPIWNKTMQAALAGLSPRDFAAPAEITTAQVCDITGAQYAPDSCAIGTARTEIVANSQLPPLPDEGFLVTEEIDSFTGLLANEFCAEFIETASFVDLTDPTAVSWINTNGNGQAWAQRNGIAVPIEPLPTEACQPGQERPRLALSAPTEGQLVSGLTEMRGSVTAPAFQSYTFTLASAATPDQFSAPLEQVFSPQPNPNSLLGVVDFTPFQNGSYILRLTVENARGATASINVPITINNVQAQPTPLPTEAAPPVQVQPPAEVTPATPDTSLTPVAPTMDPNLQPVPPSGEGQ
ncbi:MAG: hypothetical protein HC915_13555 [Anaerolineae bacterium]|nr:hypothetical protein [Anaerolineae bacterium]